MYFKTASRKWYRKERLNNWHQFWVSIYVFWGPNFGSPIPLKLVFENEYRNGPHRFQKWSCVAGLCDGRQFSRLRRREELRPAVDPGTSKNYRVLRCFVLFSFFPFFRILWLKMGQATRRRPAGDPMAQLAWRWSCQR